MYKKTKKINFADDKKVIDEKDNFRRKLIESGKQHFLIAGTNGITIRKIALDADVNLGLFVYYFKTKDQFIIEVIQDLYNDFLQVFNQEFENSKKESSALEQFRFLLQVFGNLMGKNAIIVSRFIQDMMQGDRLVMKAFAKQPPKHVQYFFEVIKECQKQKLIRTDFEPVLVYMLCVTSIGLPQVMFKHLDKKIINESSAKKFDMLVSDKALKKRIDFLLKGIKYENV